MTREDMIIFIKENPNVKITHFLFSSYEYIYLKEDGKVYDESGYLFEDWRSNIISNGLRSRKGGNWDDGWEVKFDKNTCSLLSETISGRQYLYNSVCRGCQRFRRCKYM